jgi:acyl-CoA dehydrogenase
VRWNIRRLLSSVEHALANFCENFPVRPIAWLLRFMVMPYGVQIHGPNDELDHEVARLMMTPGALRDRITKHCYTGDTSQPIGALDDAMLKVIAANEGEKILSGAQKDGRLQTVPNEPRKDLVKRAITAQVLSMEEGESVLAALEARWDVIQVDAYSNAEIYHA